MADHNLTLIYDVSNRNWYTAVAGTVVQPPVGLGQNQSVALTLKLVKSGVQYQPTGSLDWSRSGIKALNAITSGYLVTLGTPTLSGTGATAAYTFTFTVDSTELRAFILEYLPNYTQTNYALELFEATNSIATLPALGLTIYPDYTYTGTTPTSANGTINVTAGKTVTFPQSLAFPSALGTNGFQLTTDGAGALTWAASGALTDGDKGDITVSSSGAQWTIDNDTIGLAKLAHMTTNRVIGRTTSGTGAPELLTISGTGSVAMTNTPTLVTPVLGAATATSINGITITAGGSGTLTMAGSIDTSVGGGNIETHNNGGGIFTYGGGGVISTSTSGGGISTSNSGGSITTSNGGGSIDTTGNGSIGLGIAANRITLVGTTASNGKTATFPNVTGTVAVGAHSATTTHAMFSAGAAGYTTRAIATADIATALTTPGAIGGTTASTGAFTTLTLPVNNANYVPTLNLGGNKGLIGETNYVTVVNGSAYIVAFNSGGSIINCDLIANPTNSKSCGTTAGRWSNVFSVLGNFSGAVTCSTTLSVTSTTTMTGRLTANGGITVVGGSYLLTTNSALASTTGSGAGTLTNAPDAGNPTKWIAINDYGTERYIPTWEFPPPP